MEQTPQQETPAKKGLFGKREVSAGPSIPDVIEQVNSVSRRLRMLESRYTDLNRKFEVLESNFLNERKRFVNETNTINSDIVELKRSIEGLTNKLTMIIGELKVLATKEEFEALRRYVDLWEPVNFVTRNQVEKMISEALKERK